MNILMITAIAAFFAAAAAAVEVYRETHNFCITRYIVSVPRKYNIRKEIKLLFLSDLHNCVYGKENSELFHAVENEKPDLILIGGDMLVGKMDEPFDAALGFVRRLPSVCPVFYVNGNHESRMKEYREVYGNTYEEYKSSLEQSGVCFLENEIRHITVKNQKIDVSGLELPVSSYRKFKKADISSEDIRGCFECPNDSSADKAVNDPGGAEERFTILLAHNPAYMDAYLKWGADLVLSGHLHGGLVRVPGIGGIVTPQGFLFPKYSGEMTREGEQTVIVSRGLGTHTLNIRLFNMPELISVRLKPQ